MAIYPAAVEIAIPFRIDVTGGVATVSDPNAVLRQHVISIVGTQVGERVMLPGYGVNTQKYQFATDDEVQQASLESDVMNALRLWEPNADFIDGTITNVPEEATLEIIVKYRNTQINSPEQTVTMNIAGN